MMTGDYDGGATQLGAGDATRLVMMRQHLNETAARRRQLGVRTMMREQEQELERRQANARAIWMEQDAELALLEERGRADMFRMIGGGL